MRTHQGSMKMEPGSSGTIVAVKVASAYGVFAALVAIIGMLIMPPRDTREFVVRMLSTLLCSFTIGPALAVYVMTWKPELSDAALRIATQFSVGEYTQPLSHFYILGPCMLLAGLPAWWLLAGYMRSAARIREIGLVPWIKELQSLLPWRRAGGEG